jgi:FAD/FMN-containing dehydrogenase
MNEALYSWGNYPAIAQQAHPVHWAAELTPTWLTVCQQAQHTLAFGNGRSYGDSCLAVSNQVVHTRSLKRFIAVDWQTGTLCAEAGVTLQEILAVTVPHGWFLPVTPGTQYVTLGGAVANDVHGKNHHVRGTFGNHVNRFKLQRSDGSALICSLTENTDFFQATIGGLGLTGMIEWVDIQLLAIQSSYINTSSKRFDRLSDFFALSREYNGHHEYTVAWIDCLAKGKNIGRGVFMCGDHAATGGLHSKQTRSKLSLPLTPPFSFINPLSLRVFNTLYYHKHPSLAQERMVHYEPFFYPLDAILHWNRLYGNAGFQQYQCVIPNQHAEVAIAALLAAIAATGSGSFLAVLKHCGDSVSPGLLSFPLAGVSLALDFPQQDNLNSTLFPRLDAIVREANGRLYPAKDAHMSQSDFCAAYPAWERLEALRDPALYSHFWKRVTTT